MRQNEVASRSWPALVESCRVALSALGTQGSRNVLVTLDETVWSPMWDVICGLRSSPWPDMAYIGGYLNESKGEDYTYVARGASDLPSSKLSKLAVHYTLSRTDSNRHVYGVDMIPKPPKQVSDSSGQGAKEYERRFWISV